jgi:hypothetical protein
MAVDGTYLQPTELPSYYDSNKICQLLSDTGTAATSAVFSLTAPAGADDAVAWARLVDLLQSASAELDSHCQQGRRYQRADLEVMVADVDTDGASSSSSSSPT